MPKPQGRSHAPSHKVSFWDSGTGQRSPRLLHGEQTASILLLACCYQEKNVGDAIQITTKRSALPELKFSAGLTSERRCGLRMSFAPLFGVLAVDDVSPAGQEFSLAGVV